MKSCPHEAEVQAALRSGHWPEACDPDLRQHVETCSSCGEQLLVVHTFRTARAQAMETARLDHPGLLWWRAQLRRRNDALERAGKPITTAHIFAFCIGLFAVAALLQSQIRRGWSWSSWLPQSPLLSSADLLSFFTSARSDWGLLLLLTGLCTVILLSALVVYLASDRN
jgi:hypothetical protein